MFCKDNCVFEPTETREEVKLIPFVGMINAQRAALIEAETTIDAILTLCDEDAKPDALTITDVPDVKRGLMLNLELSRRIGSKLDGLRKILEG